MGALSHGGHNGRIFLLLYNNEISDQICINLTTENSLNLQVQKPVAMH